MSYTYWLWYTLTSYAVHIMVYNAVQLLTYQFCYNTYTSYAVEMPVMLYAYCYAVHIPIMLFTYDHAVHLWLCYTLYTYDFADIYQLCYTLTAYQLYIY